MDHTVCTLDIFEFDDFDEFKLAKGKQVKLDTVDVDFFNSDQYMEQIFAAHHIFIASKYNGYAMIMGLPLATPTETVLNECQKFYSFCQRLHVQVSVRSGFAREKIMTKENPGCFAYVVHHLNHNRLDARRANLLAVPMWVNSMMVREAKGGRSESIFPGVRKSGSRFRTNFCFKGKAYRYSFDKEVDAAKAFFQLKRDFLACEPNYSRFVQVYDCGKGEWRNIDVLQFCFVQDVVNQGEEEIAKKIELILLRALEKGAPPVASLKYSEEGEIVDLIFEKRVERIRGEKRIVLDLSK